MPNMTPNPPVAGRCALKPCSAGEFRLQRVVMEDQHVKCNTHGPNLPAIACHHLREAGSSASVYVGWVQAQFDPSNRQPGDLMAWCNECDTAYEKGGGWSEASEPISDFRVVCEQCFHDLCAAQRRLRTDG